MRSGVACGSHSRWRTSSTGRRWSTAHRTAVVDEPGAAGSLGHRDLRRAGGPGPGHGPGARRPGGRPRRAGRHRQPELRPVPDLLLRCQRLRAGARADQLPPHRRRDRLHRRALRRVRPPVRPRAGRRGRQRHQGRAPLRARRHATTPTCSRRPPTEPQPQEWAADEDATCSVNYTSGTTARPKGVQLTQRNCWLNAATFGWHTGVSDRDVLLHTLPMFHCNGWGMPYAVTGHGRHPHRAAQGRRRGDPVADRARTA